MKPIVQTVFTVFLVPLLASLALAACARPRPIPPAYVSPLEFQAFTCDQLDGELKRIQPIIAEGEASNPRRVAVAVAATPTMSIVLPPDPMFEELRRLKGEAMAIQQAAAEKNCTAASR